MNLNELDFTKIKYQNLTNYTKITYNLNEFEFNINNAYIPFGIEKNYDNYIIKILKNSNTSSYFEKLLDIEKNHINFLSLDSKLDKELINFNSQIIEKKNYGDFLIVKIPIVKKQFQVDIFDKNNDRKNIFDINKKQIANLKLYIDNLWNFKGKYSCPVKVKEITLL